MVNSTERQIAERADNWEKWGWIWSAIFYVSLAVSFILPLISNELTPSEQSTVVLFVVLSAVWHFLGVILFARRYPEHRQRTLLVTFYLAGAVAFWWVLVNINNSFYFVLFGLFGQIFFLLPLRWSIPVALIVAGLVAYSQTGFNLSWRSPILWITMAMSASGVLIALWLEGIISQSVQRRELIEQLAATREELATAEREAGVLAERQRLAGEIHDTLAQGFTSIVMHLEAAEQVLPPDAAAAAHHLDQARRVARDSLAEARGLVWSLRPERLQQATLPEALDRVLRRWTDSTGVQSEFQVTGEVQPLHPQAEVTLLRATQEALANVAKHAAATETCITISYFSDLVMLDVQDNGRGFDPDQPAERGPALDGGFGLPAMRARVEQLGGSLAIETAPGEGTTLVVEIPLQ